ncbi:ketopantoate reductase family protein [Anaerosporobacter sp.]|uniref:ketopantoate reductase family protein n=1 Tax=Anaerosporobacter sp. TaxID=1872529 RepID=UPI00286F6C7C|nr:2-dehydropantoate 2-reductase [Anaerosporobacter sp.]
MKNIAFLGIGGVGGYFGGKMTQLLNDSEPDINIFFIARGKHLKAIKENGLTLETKTEGILKCIPTLATDNCEELPKLDICFICVKQYDLEDAIKKILPQLDTNTKIIPLLNGIDIYDRIRRITDKGIIFPACVYVGTHIKSYGVVEQNGGACTITFGQDPDHKDINADDVCELMSKAKIKFEWSNKHIEAIWSKYMFIAAYGLVTASENKTLGEVLDNEESSRKVIGIMKEIESISKAENIRLPDNIVDFSYQMAKNFPYEAKTSFQRDYELKDKLDERELFGQTIIDLGVKHGIDTTVAKSVYQKLKYMI